MNQYLLKHGESADRKVYVLIELVEEGNSGDMGGPVYGIPATVSEKILNVFSTEEKALSAKEKAEKEDARRVVELLCDPCEYKVAEYEVK